MKFPCRMKIVDVGNNAYLKRHIAENGLWIEVIGRGMDSDMVLVQSPGRAMEEVFITRLRKEPEVVLPNELFEI